MKKLILFLCLIVQVAFAQISNMPPPIGTFTAFRLNPLDVAFTMPDAYTMPDTITAELWAITGSEGQKISIVPTVVVTGKTVTAKLTKAQIGRMPKSTVLYVIFGSGPDAVYLLSAKINTALGTGTPSNIPATVNLPAVGEIKINLIGDPSLAFTYGQIAQTAAVTATAAAAEAVNKIPLSQKGVANGVGTLSSDLKQPLSEVRPSLISSAGTTGVIANFLKAGSTYYGFKSEYTGSDIIANTATKKSDGTNITNSDVDNIVYFKFSDGTFGKRKFPAGLVDIDEFGAKGDSTTDNTSAILKALNFSNGIQISNGVYLVGNMIFPASKTVSFVNGARLCVIAFQQVKFRSRINASPDDWIFDCQDNPTNYTNQNTSTYTSKPLLLNDTTTLSFNATAPVHLRWFGAKGIGYKNSVIGTYYESLTVPTSQYIDDTKYIRFAFTAIGEASHQTGHGAPAAGGSNTMLVPKGLFAVSQPVYISSGTFVVGVGSSQNLGSMFVQMDPSKTLFVLQSAGSGGEGGGGSAHNIDNLSIGSRPTVSGLGTTNAYLIEFQDNKFNLDSRFNRLRISNVPVGGAAFYVNEKIARYNGEIGSGTKRGLNVTFHLYNCMFDVAAGDIIRVGANGTMGARFYDCQFFNVSGNIVNNSTKTTANIETLDFASWFEFFQCNFEGVGTAGSSSFFVNDQYAKLKLINCEMESRTVDGSSLGAPIQIDRAKQLIISGGTYTHSLTESNGGLYFLYLNGLIDNLNINNINTFRYTTAAGIPTINISSSFYSPNISITNNAFSVTPTTNLIVYADNPSTASTGNISGNSFSACAVQAIVGNTNPGIVYQSNTFVTPQDPKSESLVNYGMKGHTVIYRTAAPSSGTWYAGDQAINSNPSAGNPKGWTYTSSGWVSTGNL